MHIRFVFMMILTGCFTYLTQAAEPVGALLMHENSRYGYYNVPGDAGHHYFNFLEGPAWENKYCAFRMYVDKDDRNAIDIFGKRSEGLILKDFNDASDDPHSNWSWGSDILKVGSAMGLGSFRLFNNGQWINPQLPETLDSLVLTIADSSVETPKVEVGYYGWNIGGGKKVTVLWTLSTSYEDRATHCELFIDGDYSGKVVAGMVNHHENTSNPNRNTVSVIQEENPPLLATLGKQAGIPEGYTDSSLMAIYTDDAYFDSFTKDGSTNLGMVLTPDDEKKVRWSFAYSWVGEQDPLFRHADWKETLVPPTGVSYDCRGIKARTAKRRVFRATDFQTAVYDLRGRTLGNQVGAKALKRASGMHILQKERNTPAVRMVTP